MTRVTILVAGLAAGGCSWPQESLDSPLPNRRTEALTDPAKIDDPSTIRGRIVLLDSDDPLVRMLAIRSLERMTGTTLGYDHAAGQQARDQAVAAWVDWYESGGIEAVEQAEGREG